MASMKTSLLRATLCAAIILSGAVWPPQEVRAVELKNAKATFEQKGFRVANVLADDSAGWAIHPKTHMAQSATFETAVPLSLKGRTRLAFTLKHAAIANFNLGRFRLSVTPDARVGRASKWTQLAPASATSAGGATLRITADNSILAGGKNPDHDTYSVVARTSLRRVTGFRLEVLTDATLPETGPGRDRLAAPGTRGNFVLTSFKVDLPPDVEKAAQARLGQAERSRRTALSAKVGAEGIVFAVRHRSRSYHWYDDIGWFSADTSAKLYCAPGSQLRRLNLDSGKVSVLLEDRNGAFRDPQVHYDGKKMIFSWRRGGGDYYHLYEVNLDGTGLKQLTDGPFDDIEPTYLPDMPGRPASGGILFTSTRCNSWVCCGSFKVTTLHRCDVDGKNIRKVSASALNENTPWVLPDGRVLYMRWEYVDRNQMRYQHLWTMNPDGTGVMVYYGNQFPGNVFIDAKPIQPRPGSEPAGTNNVVYVESPGHGRLDHAGTLMVVDPRNGPDDRASSKPLDLGKYNRLQRAHACFDPYPVPDGFLFSSGREILLTDGRGHTEALYSLGGSDPGSWIIQEPRPVSRRPRERLIPSRVDLSKTTGRLLLANVNHGRNMKSVKPGQIKKLLVLEQLPKPVSFQISWNQPISMGGTFTFKRIVGTVPVERDGSAWFEAPAMRNLFFVALDADNMSVKRMQSYVTLQPGEVTGCVGCHEKRTEVPRADLRRLLAVRRPPSKLTPVPDVPDVMDFPRDIQPILDKHCVSCHGYQATGKNGPRAGGVILTGDRGPWFSHAYATLTVRKQLADGRNAHGDRPPRAIGSSASPLMKLLDGQHFKVRLTPREKTRVRLWIETGAAYPGTYAAGGTGMIDIHNPQRFEPYPWGTMSNPHPVDGSVCVRMPPPKQILTRRCAACHRKVPLDPQLLYNLSRPAKSMLLLAPLAKTAGGLGLCKPPVFANTADPDYRGILAGIQAASRKLNQIRRFDMPGFRPRPGYIREMKNYGILPAAFDPATGPVDVYKLDQAYWRSLWHRPRTPHSQADVESGRRR